MCMSAVASVQSHAFLLCCSKFGGGLNPEAEATLDCQMVQEKFRLAGLRLPVLEDRLLEV